MGLFGRWMSARELADLRGKVDAVSRAQPMIEFDMDGIVLNANDNFLKASKYALSEIRGRHHSMFVDPEQRNTPEYKEFWNKLRRGEMQSAQYRRMARNGRPVWVSAIYYPIVDGRGRPFKVVKYTNDITEQMLTQSDVSGQVAAISKAQAVAEFDLRAIMRMDEGTQQNAALVEEAAAASQAIVTQAHALNSLIARYNVGDAAAAPAPTPSVRAEVAAAQGPRSVRRAG